MSQSRTLARGDDLIDVLVGRIAPQSRADLVFTGVSTGVLALLLSIVGHWWSGRPETKVLLVAVFFCPC